jgi:hypothetical protein
MASNAQTTSAAAGFRVAELDCRFDETIHPVGGRLDHFLRQQMHRAQRTHSLVAFGVAAPAGGRSSRIQRAHDPDCRNGGRFPELAEIRRPRNALQAIRLPLDRGADCSKLLTFDELMDVVRTCRGRQKRRKRSWKNPGSKPGLL